MSLCFVIVVFLVVDGGLYLSAAIFPDDDMARSDSRMNEESRWIQAKCLMETHVKVFWFCFTHGCLWIGYPGFEVHVNVVGIVLLTVLNMLMSVEWISLTLLICL